MPRSTMAAAAGAMALVVAASACGGGGSGAGARDARRAARETTRIALLPAVWVAGGSALPVDATGSLTRGLEAEGGVSVRAAEQSAMGDRTAAACADDLGCVREVGARARASKAVVTRLAELGDTVVVRVSMVDVRGGTQETARQEVVREATTARLGAALERVAREIARPFAPPRPVPDDAWYQRWELWAGAGAVVAVGGTAAVLLLMPEGGPEPDRTIVGLEASP